MDLSGSFLVEPTRISDVATVWVPQVRGEEDSIGLVMLRWGSNPEVFFEVRDSHGEMIGNSQRVTDPFWSSVSPEVEWTGSFFGVAWMTGEYAHMSPGFALFDAGGTMIGEPLIVSNERRGFHHFSDNPPSEDLLWTGSEYVLVWNDWRDAPDPDHCPNDDGEWGWCYSELYMARIGVCGGSSPRCQADRDCNDGDPCTRDSCDTSTGDCISSPATGPALGMVEVAVTDHEWFSGYAVVEGGGDGLGIAWSDGREHGCRENSCEQDVYFQAYSLDGSPRGPSRKLIETGSRSYPGDVVWTGSSYGVASHRLQRDVINSVWMAVASSDGIAIGSGTEIPPSTFDATGPAAAWSGSEITMIWAEYGIGLDPEALRMARFTPGGDLVDTTVLDEHHDITPHFCDLAWTGSEYVAAYIRDGDFIVARITPEGTVAGTMREYAMSHRAPIKLVWTGSELRTFVSKSNRSCSLGYCVDILMYPVDLVIEEILDPVIISSVEGEHHITDALWTGSEIALAWSESAGWSDPGHVTWLDPEGLPTRESLDLDTPVDIAWTGSTVALAWTDWREGSWNVYLSYAGSCD
jgi:hypothetical protein